MLLNFSPRIPYIGIFGAIGFSAGTAVGLYAGVKEGLAILPCSITAALILLGFFVQAFATKIITGHESHVLYRHLLFSLAITAITLAASGENVLLGLDVFTISFGIFHFFGRFGCLFGGCCHGRPSRYGIIYGERYSGTGFPLYLIGRKIYPTQLAESVCIATITLVTAMILHYSGKAGAACCTYLLLYGFARFLLEFLRGDTDRPFAAGFSEAQWTSAAIAAAISVLQWTGIFPFSVWQQVFAATHLLVMAGVYGLMSKKTEMLLHDPRHTDELVEIVNKGIADNTMNDQLPVGRTSSQGICITFSTFTNEPKSGYHIAFSANGQARRKERIEETFRIIRELKFPGQEFKMIADRNGVMHYQVYTNQ